MAKLQLVRGSAESHRYIVPFKAPPSGPCALWGRGCKCGEGGKEGDDTLKERALLCYLLICPGGEQELMSPGHRALRAEPGGTRTPRPLPSSTRWSQGVPALLWAHLLNCTTEELNALHHWTAGVSVLYLRQWFADWAGKLGLGTVLALASCRAALLSVFAHRTPQTPDQDTVWDRIASAIASKLHFDSSTLTEVLEI